MKHQLGQPALGAGRNTCLFMGLGQGKGMGLGAHGLGAGRNTL